MKESEIKEILDSPVVLTELSQTLIDKVPLWLEAHRSLAVRLFAAHSLLGIAERHDGADIPKEITVLLNEWARINEFARRKADSIATKKRRRK